MQVQQIPGHSAPPMPMGMPHPSLPPGALGGPLGAPSQHALAILNKQELHRPEETKSNSGLSAPEDRHVSFCFNLSFFFIYYFRYFEWKKAIIKK